jgi:hypothetical protein
MGCGQVRGPGRHYLRRLMVGPHPSSPRPLGSPGRQPLLHPQGRRALGGRQLLSRPRRRRAPEEPWRAGSAPKPRPRRQQRAGGGGPAPVTTPSTAPATGGVGAATAGSAGWSRGASVVSPVVVGGSIATDFASAADSLRTPPPPLARQRAPNRQHPHPDATPAGSSTMASKSDGSTNTHFVTASRISWSLLGSSVVSR